MRAWERTYNYERFSLALPERTPADPNRRIEFNLHETQPPPPTPAADALSGVALWDRLNAHSTTRAHAATPARRCRAAHGMAVPTRRSGSSRSPAGRSRTRFISWTTSD